MPPEKLEQHITGTAQPPDPLVTATPELVVPIAPGATEPPAVDTASKEEAPVTHQVPQSEFKKLKEKAHEKGRQAAMAELAEKAKEAGFESVDAAFAGINDLNTRLDELTRQPEPKAEDEDPMAQPKRTTTKNKRPGQPKRSNTRGKDDRMANKNAQEIERLERDRQKGREKWRREEKRRKTAERKNLALRAEMDIREIAINAGVKDVDYAVRLMTRECAKPEWKDKLGEFDEKEFFTDLRDSKPYLFGEVTVPANTGTGVGDDDTPQEPKPGEVLTKNAEDTHFDARSASKEDYDKRMRELGLNTSGSMSV